MTSQVVHLSGLPSAERYKLGASWGLGNNLMAYPVPVVRAPTASTHNQESSSGYRGGPNVQLQNVTWETTLYEPVFRKLVNESLAVFLNLQKMSRDEEGNYFSFLSTLFEEVILINLSCYLHKFSITLGSSQNSA